MFLLVLALSLLMAAPALAVEVSDGDALQTALNDPAVDSVTIIAPLAFPEGEITVDKLLIFRAPEGVNDFVIGKDTVVTLTEKGTIATVSSFEEAFFLNRVLVYGALDARAGSVAPGSFLVENPGALLMFSDDAKDIVVDHIITSQEDLLKALDDSFCGAILLQDDPAAGKGAEVIIDRLLTLDGELYVIANADFVSLRIVEGGALTLTENAVLGTQSNIDFEHGFFAIAQVWLDGGSLNASAGSVLPDSMLYVRSGEWTLPRDAENVIVSGGAVTVEGLLALLADERIGEIMVHADIALTQDTAVNRILRVQDGATLTLQGCTLTIGEKGELVVGEGSGVYNQGVLLNQGRITLEAGSEYQGGAPAGSGEMIRE